MAQHRKKRHGGASIEKEKGPQGERHKRIDGFLALKRHVAKQLGESQIRFQEGLAADGHLWRGG
jgi:hypothetical protein